MCQLKRERESNMIPLGHKKTFIVKIHKKDHRKKEGKKRIQQIKILDSNQNMPLMIIMMIKKIVFLSKKIKKSKKDLMIQMNMKKI
jgi:hypothetical protein